MCDVDGEGYMAWGGGMEGCMTWMGRDKWRGGWIEGCMTCMGRDV